MAAANGIFTASASNLVHEAKLRHCHIPQHGDQPLFAERRIRIICIGAGASGLCLAYKLERSFRNFELIIYEKNPEISGTWWENRYPGCACDVPAHNYTFSWEPAPETSAVYASSAELLTYFQRFAKKYELYKYVKLRHEVVNARWDDHSWTVDAKDLEQGTLVDDCCDILINAAGILNNWKMPEIPGLANFNGPIVHSGAWDPQIEIECQTVGLIGNGSSGIQILPAIQRSAKKVVTFVRGSTWVSPVHGLEQHIYTKEERKRFRSDPEALLKYRKLIETSTNCLFGIFMSGSETQIHTRKDLTEQMRTKLKNNTALSSRLVPDWSPGCRRLTPGVDYLESLSEANVQVELSEIQQITDDGCICQDGTKHTFDVLICATGFDVSFRPRHPIIAPGGDLRELWKTNARSYLGTAAADVPNYFLFLGPNCPIGNGPVLPVIESQADYMLKWVDRWQTENIRSFFPKKEAVDDFIAHTDAFMTRTVWSENCRSWYKNGTKDGRIVALWPGSSLHFLEAMEYPRYDDFTVEYNGNRFAWMGNGYSQTELDPSADWAYYIRQSDDSPYLSKALRREVLDHRHKRQ